MVNWDLYEDQANCTSVLDVDISAKDGMDLVLALIVTVVASVFNVSGTLSMKIAQEREKVKSPEKRSLQWNGVVLNLWWLLSFLVVLSANGGEAVALMLASQSILAPFSGLNILLAMAMGPTLLGERVSVAEGVGAVIILLGTLLCTLFGPQTSIVYDVDFLLARWTSTPMLVYLPLWVASCSAGVALLKFDFLPKRYSFIGAVLTGYLVGSYGSMVATVLKGLMELLQQGAPSTHPAVFALYFLVTLFFCLSYIVILNMGLERHDGTLFYPLYLGWLIVFGVLNGSIYFLEHTCYDTINWVMFPCGCAVTIAGMLVLSFSKAHTPQISPATQDGTSEPYKVSALGVPVAKIQSQGNRYWGPPGPRQPAEGCAVAGPGADSGGTQKNDLLFHDTRNCNNRKSGTVAPPAAENHPRRSDDDAGPLGPFSDYVSSLSRQSLETLASGIVLNLPRLELESIVSSALADGARTGQFADFAQLRNSRRHPEPRPREYAQGPTRLN